MDTDVLQPELGLQSTFAKRTRKKLIAQIVAVENLTAHQQARMYQIFQKYYSQHSHQQFLQDLQEKDHAILLQDEGSIQGFSTILHVELSRFGLKGRGIYSGDTVLEQAYWGSPALGIAFLRHLWLEKIRRPWRPLYWFLISKGYKTYLLMANNFATHFPRHELKTPERYQEIMAAFYGSRFVDEYNAQTGLIAFNDPSCCLKENVAELTETLMKNPRIRFFAEKNPKWNLGHELTCIAKMTFWMPFKYAVKKAIKRKWKSST